MGSSERERRRHRAPDRLIAQMAKAATAQDRKRFVPANRHFHFTVYRAANSDTLLAIIELLWLQISPYFDLLHAQGNWRTANRCHQQMRDALARGDGGAARAALGDDIEAAAAVLRELLSPAEVVEPGA